MTDLQPREEREALRELLKEIELVRTGQHHPEHLYRMAIRFAALAADTEPEEHVGIRFLEWLLAEARYERDEAERKLAWSLSVAEPEGNDEA